jgi:hypothetical protein
MLGLLDLRPDPALLLPLCRRIVEDVASIRLCYRLVTLSRSTLLRLDSFFVTHCGSASRPRALITIGAFLFPDRYDVYPWTCGCRSPAGHSDRDLLML